MLSKNRRKLGIFIEVFRIIRRAKTLLLVLQKLFIRETGVNRGVNMINSLSASPINPGHQCPCLKSLIARPDFPNSVKNNKQENELEAIYI